MVVGDMICCFPCLQVMIFLPVELALEMLSLLKYIMANQINVNEIGWNYGTPIGGKLRKTQCNFCSKTINGGGVTRPKEHLAGFGGDVSACPSVPQEVKKLIRSHFAQKRNDRNKGKLDKQREQEELMSRPQQQDSNNEDDENEEQRDIRRVMRESRETYRDEVMHRSHRQSGVGSSQIERNVRSKSTRAEGDFDTLAAGRIDSYMQHKGEWEANGARGSLTSLNLSSSK